MSSSPISSSSINRAEEAFIGMLDVRCQVDVLVGHGSISVAEFLKLQPDSIIRLREDAGADLLLQVHGLIAATGEIVVDDDTSSIKITEILPPPSGEADL